MAVCDASYYSTLVDIGVPGRYSDGGVFRNCIWENNNQSNRLSFCY